MTWMYLLKYESTAFNMLQFSALIWISFQLMNISQRFFVPSAIPNVPNINNEKKNLKFRLRAN